MSIGDIIICVVFGFCMYLAGRENSNIDKALTEEESCQERCEKGRCPKDESTIRKNINRDYSE